MPLKITLKAGERAIIGDAVVANGGVKCDLLIENDVPILREKEILSLRNADSPCKRIYFAIQLMYVDAPNLAQHRETYRQLLQDVLEAAPSTGELIGMIDDLVTAGRYYQALKHTKELIGYEQELITHVTPRT